MLYSFSIIGIFLQAIERLYEAAKSEERIPPMATDKLETERENKKEPITSSTSSCDMKVKELQEALEERICSGGNNKKGIHALISLLQEPFIGGRDEY